MNVNKSNATIALLLVCAMLLTLNLTSHIGIARAAAPQATPTALTIPAPTQQPVNPFTKIAKEAEPSVVQIVSTIQEKRSNNMRWFFNGQPSENPFGENSPFGNMIPGFPNAPQQPRRAQGLGSGFIVDRNGYILTNNHVVENATRVQVTLPGDHTEYAAKVIGTDPELDLAVIKIDAGKPLPALPIGNSDAIEVGDWAVAIGSPFGLEQSMTAGIISAKGRDLGERDHQLQRFLQTDAAINRGNSGGPLLNINGQVIGINTMIVSGSGNFEGIGFALPINTAVNSYNQIIKSGKVSRGAIGIQFAREDNPSLLKVYGASNGVFVSQVTPNGPAAKAGVQVSDVILAVNGKNITTGEQLVEMISAAQPGSSVDLKVLRDGKTMTVPVKIGDRAAIVAENGEQGAPEAGEQGEGPTTHARLGVSVQNLSQADREQMGLKATGGVVIASVEPGSFAEDIGLQKGDVLLEINRHHITSGADVRNIMESAKPGEAMAFKVMRGDGNGNWQSLFAAGSVPQQQ